MRSRYLRKLLNNTEYAVHFSERKLCIGSPMCSKLITVDSKTLKMKYSLDTFNEGRKSIKSKELEFIWDKLLELIESGEIKSIIEDNDSTEGMFPVYCCDNGEVMEKFADVFGWPNSTHDGTLMYNNTFFKSEIEAIEYGIKDCGYAVDMYSKRVSEMEKDIQEKKTTLDEYKLKVNKLNEKLSVAKVAAIVGV